MSSNEWKQVKLSEVCEYGKDKLNINDLELTNYISTENMLPEKAGVTIASGLPISKTLPAFKMGDVLVSNIRPYFKKIWFANKTGGCSNDVLVFRAKRNIYDNKFLYYNLSFDGFFDYSMSTSKGTKMPRGDKSALMNYIVPLIPLSEQKSIAATLSCLDDMIELNNRTNQILEEIAQAIFKSWFIDFEFPNEDGEPYKSSGGEMVESELGEIPKGWRVASFTEEIEVCGGGTPNTSNPSYWNGEIPFFTPKDSMNSYYVVNTEKHITQVGLDKCNSRLYLKNTVFVTARGTVGKINLAASPMAMNQSCYALRSKADSSLYFIHQLAMNTVNALKHKASGAVFDAIVTRDFESENIVIVPTNYQMAFEIYVKPLYELMQKSAFENQCLKTIRDSLLPKLMSGEIRVPVEEVV